MKTVDPVHAPARHMLVDFLTKPKSGQSILRESSCLMGHMHFSFLLPDHFETLSSLPPVSAMKIFLPISEKPSSKSTSISSFESFFLPGLESFEVDNVLSLPVHISQVSSIDLVLDSSII